MMDDPSKCGNSKGVIEEIKRRAKILAFQSLVPWTLGVLSTA